MACSKMPGPAGAPSVVAEKDDQSMLIKISMSASGDGHAVGLPHSALKHVVAFQPRAFRRTCKEFNRFPHSVLLRWIRLSFLVSLGNVILGKWYMLRERHSRRGVPILREALFERVAGLAPFTTAPFLTPLLIFAMV